MGMYGDALVGVFGAVSVAVVESLRGSRHAAPSVGWQHGNPLISDVNF